MVDGDDRKPALSLVQTSPFDDLEGLRLPPENEILGAKKTIMSVPVGKPDRQHFVRVHPDPEYRFDSALLELKLDREIYLVMPQVALEIPGEYFRATVFTCINRQGNVSLWPIRLPDPDGRQLEWHRTAREAAEMAMKRWLRVVANRSIGAYDVYEATGNIPEPEWPDIGFKELLKIAFRDRLIDNPHHPVLKRLRGAV
jgi:hypothetical protein